jgi:hypothetical protein
MHAAAVQCSAQPRVAVVDASLAVRCVSCAEMSVHSAHRCQEQCYCYIAIALLCKCSTCDAGNADLLHALVVIAGGAATY